MVELPFLTKTLSKKFGLNLSQIVFSSQICRCYCGRYGVEESQQKRCFPTLR